MRKIGLLLIAIVLALGALGVGYAAWAQPLYIDGTVNMGYIAANFYSSEDPTDPYAVVDSSVGQTDPKATIPNGTEILDNKLTINIEDAYPGFNGIVYFKLKNIGTVPFYLENLNQANIKVFAPDGVTEVTNILQITDSGVEWDDQIVEPVGTGVVPNNTISDWYPLEISVPGVGVSGFVDPDQNVDYTIEIDLMVTQSM